ncbi:MAG: outer membrane lipoprotein carrier protein LolA [Nitrospirae bacterium]|nr:MAG: outer membrane lipoprotein carrier protein LolA [Nitrospirota bacterium]
MIRSLLLSVAGLLLIYSSGSAGEIEKFFEKVKGIQTLEGTFYQKNYYSELEESFEFKGHFVLKRPDKLAWRYDEGSKDSVYVIGTKATLIQPEEKQAILHDISTLGITKAPILFIFNREMIKKDFIVLSETKTEIVLKPKDNSMGLKRVTIVLHSSGNFPVKGIKFEDLYNNVIEIMFENLNINPKVKESDFQFSIPKGYTVLDTSA